MTRRDDCCARSRRGFGAARACRTARAAPKQSAGAQDAARCRPRRRAVIYLFMHGGVSHVDTFDPKPELTAQRPAALGRAGEDDQDQLHSRSDQGHAARQPVGVPARRQERPAGLRSFPERARTRRRSRRHPKLLRRRVRSRAGDLSAQLRLAVPGPALPGLLGHLRAGHREPEPAGVRRDADGSTKSGPPAYGAGFLPAVYQGTVFRGGENPILYLRNPPA